ncbi:DUF4192 domain-containing protein [Streptomyces triculaminicus]|uniref:DUF4192 domain-containing protein n=1 Tax=Streptomyces triculaminicus TaxID=2816232 RepID=A0A939FQB0_9ACTN|nr:DUF4192 domain-containing protein [Streptomyces triculaminicus]MBO0655412.1 DUF4192 domain-containing protein [Streptomyces triculaminicus]
MTQRDESARPSVSPAAPSPAWDARSETQITLRSPGELADALPYLMGFHPTDSVVLLALHGERGRFGGRLRLGIPRNSEEWPEVSDQLAETLVAGCVKRGARPDGIVLFLCQDPRTGESGREVMERLRPLAQSLRLACGGLDVPVYEALCLSDGRFWSYCCPDERCCPAEGTLLALPGTSVMAAAAAYAGIQVRGTLREMEARYAPLEGERGREQESALDAAAADLIPRILGGTDGEMLRRETLDLADLVVERFRVAPPLAAPPEADARDDALLACDEAAAIILGLQDRVTRDRAAEWMEGPRAAAVLRLWRALARRCVPPYTEHAAAPLTLAGWVAWSMGDHPDARVALSQALTADPEYLFAQLLHRACNDGMDPEPLRRCLRGERRGRAEPPAAVTGTDTRTDAGVITRGTKGADEPGEVRDAIRDGDPEGVPGGIPQEVGPAGPDSVVPAAGAASPGPGGPARPGGPSAPAGVKGPAGKARTRRRAGQRGVRGRQ